MKTVLSVLGALTVLTATAPSQAIGTSSAGGGTFDCSGAAASDVIWPPNHKMVPITVVGLPDPDNLGVSIVITGIQQDEPLQVNGSGNTQPDGNGIGTDTAWVRAERAGPGTGRIYFISFTATNATGAQCSGSVQTYVPHDQGQGSHPIDTGARYDSTGAT
jgi:hypothetical protein